MDLPHSVPASFRYVAFYDLLVDAAFHHRLATASADGFEMSRHARASILSAALCIESLANCLLDAAEVSKSLRDQLDKLPPLPKIETALRLGGIVTYDRGRSQVQRAAELMTARNDFVHPKTSQLPTAIQEIEDAGNEWRIPFSFDADMWRGLDIPKCSMFWFAPSSGKVLLALRDYLEYVLVQLMKADEDTLGLLLPSRLEVGEVRTAGVYDEFRREMSMLKGEGLDFSFLKISELPDQPPTPSNEKTVKNSTPTKFKRYR